MPKQTTKKQLEVAVAALEASIEVASRRSPEPFISVTIDAPAGKVWRATGTHSIATHADVGTAAELREVAEDIYSDTLATVEDGVEDCTEADCDTCANR